MKLRLLFLIVLLTATTRYAIAEPSFEKISETEFTGTETKTVETIYSLIDLKNDKQIYEAEILNYQEKIAAVDALIAKAEEFGIVEDQIK